MEKRKLGKSGIEVNKLGLGCMRLSAPAKQLGGTVWEFNAPDQNRSIKLLRTAVDMGFDFFDTSNAYGAGQNEETLGKAFSGIRDKVVISTKFGHLIDETTRTLMRSGNTTPLNYIQSIAFPAMIKWQCEQSLRRLKTDYIDLFNCHVGRAINIEEILETLEELVKEGKIRTYGWSIERANDLELVEKFSKGKNCSSLGIRLNVVDNKNDILQICDKNGQAAMITGPLGSGLLGKKAQDVSLNEAQSQKLKKLDAVREILTSDGRSVVQGALCWLWARSKNTLPIPGFRTMEQLEGLCGTLEYGPLKPEQMSEIEVIMNK